MPLRRTEATTRPAGTTQRGSQQSGGLRSRTRSTQLSGLLPLPERTGSTDGAVLVIVSHAWLNSTLKIVVIPGAKTCPRAGAYPEWGGTVSLPKWGVRCQAPIRASLRLLKSSVPHAWTVPEASKTGVIWPVIGCPSGHPPPIKAITHLPSKQSPTSPGSGRRIVRSRLVRWHSDDRVVRAESGDFRKVNGIVHAWPVQ